MYRRTCLPMLFLHESPLIGRKINHYPGFQKPRSCGTHGDKEGVTIVGMFRKFDNSCVSKHISKDSYILTMAYFDFQW